MDNSIAIIGKGNFGRSLARLLDSYAPQCQLLLLDKAVDSEAIPGIAGIAACDLIIPAVPLAAFSAVLQQMRPHLTAGSIVADVCTTKTWPARQMHRHLPESVHLITSHPLFGPESLERAGWKLNGLNLVIWPERIPAERFEPLLAGLRATGLNVILKSPQEHDRILAESQFLSLLTGALLERLDIQQTEMNTRSFDELLDVRNTTRNDFHILRDVFRYNPDCAPVLDDVLEKLQQIAAELKAYREKQE